MSLKEKYSQDNPANQVRPDMKFVFASPAHAIALFFGAGCIRPAPGTWGTLAGVLVWALLAQFCSWRVLFGLVLIGFFVGEWAVSKTEEDLGVHDAGCIVIDEVVAVWLTMVMFPQTWVTWVCAFATFRFYDIMKFPPADKIEAKMQNARGVMMDDIVAAGWSIVLLIVLDKVAMRFGVTFLGLLS